MFQQVSLRIANKMAKEMVIDTGKVRVYAFGLELLLSSAAGVLALVAASIIGKKPLAWVPYLAGFVPIRMTGGGYYAKSHRNCISIFTAVYLFVFFLADAVVVPALIWIPISVADLLILFLLSPVEARNKPMKENQRKQNRGKSICIGITNLAIAMVLSLLYPQCPNWITMYFTGASMACLSMLAAVKI